MRRVFVALVLLLAAAPTPVEALGRGARLYQDGDYAAARTALLPVAGAHDPAHDYVTERIDLPA